MDGGVAADFVNKLRGLDTENFQNELYVEKFLIKNEAFSGKVKEGRCSSATKRDSFYPPNPSRSSLCSTRPDRTYPLL